MTLTKKIVGLGSAALISLGTLNEAPNSAFAQPKETIQQKRARVEQEKKESCKQTIKKHEPKLKGKYFGLGSGCLDNFKPKRAGKNNHFNAFSCVNLFLTEYNSKKCDKKEPLYLDSLEAMFNNSNTGDSVTDYNVNNALRKDGFLDYKGQLNQSVKAAEEIKKQADGLMKDLPLLRPGAEQKRAQEKITSWQNYLENLRVQAYLIPHIALSLREKPKRTSSKGIDPKRIKGLMKSYAALSDLVSMEFNSGDSGSWYQAYNNFLSWKKNQEGIYRSMLDILDHSQDYGKFKAGEGHRWKKVRYLDTKGNPQLTIATKEFKQMWGTNGENFYEPIEKIDGIRREVNRFKTKIDRVNKIHSVIDELNEVVKNGRKDTLKKRSKNTNRSQERKNKYKNLQTCRKVDQTQPENVLANYFIRTIGYHNGECSKKDLDDLVYPLDNRIAFKIFGKNRLKGFKRHSSKSRTLYKQRTGIPGVDKYFKIRDRKGIEGELTLIYENKEEHCTYSTFAEEVFGGWRLRIGNSIKFKCN